MPSEPSRDNWRLATRAVHRPPLPSQAGAPIAPSLDPSSTYEFDDAETFARASEEKVGHGYVYARWANPTVDLLEAAVADLEGAEAAEAFASGMAAISAVFFALCPPGSRVVATRQLYGQTYSFITSRLAELGIDATMCNVDDHEGIRAAAEGAALLYCETIGNPRVQMADLDVLGTIASDAGIPLVVDNTFASPVLCRPLQHGAQVVLHSATKFLGGHHDLLGGVVCTTEPLVARLQAVERDLGAMLAPFNAWLVMRGLATLPLRVLQSCDAALAIAQSLEHRDDIEAVYFPALAASPDRPLAERLCGGRGGGVLGFDVAGGRTRAAAFQDRLRLVSRAASLGGTHSLLVHAASITHTQLSPEELAGAGISEGFCRLSVGLEDPDDLISDIRAALDAV
jgi:cystathionine beta-lyase/cystathionine gamma-synthase